MAWPERKEKKTVSENTKDLSIRYPLAKDPQKAASLETKRRAILQKQADYAYKKWGSTFNKEKGRKEYGKDDEWTKLNDEVRKIEDEYYRAIGYRK